MSGKKVKKLMTFSEKLYEKIEEKAEAFGIPFQEYVRHVLVNDIEDFYIGPTEYVDDKTAKEIKKGIDDMRAGNYVEFDPDDKKQMRKALS